MRATVSSREPPPSPTPTCTKSRLTTCGCRRGIGQKRSHGQDGPDRGTYSVRHRLRFLRRFLLQRPPVTGEELLAVLAQVQSGRPGGIRPVAHHPFPENAVVDRGIDAICVREVHSLGDPRPVLRAVRRLDRAPFARGYYGCRAGRCKLIEPLSPGSARRVSRCFSLLPLRARRIPRGERPAG